MGYRLFQDISAATAQNDFSGSETGDSVDCLVHNDPARRPYCMFKKFKIPDSHKISGMVPVRLDATITRIVDSFRLVALSGGSSRATLSNEDLISGAKYPARFIENTVKPGWKGGHVPWNSARPYCTLLYIAANK